MRRGRPDPLGVTWGKDGSVNFALYSLHAENVVLCLYEADAIEPSVSSASFSLPFLRDQSNSSLQLDAENNLACNVGRRITSFLLVLHSSK